MRLVSTADCHLKGRPVVWLGGPVISTLPSGAPAPGWIRHIDEVAHLPQAGTIAAVLGTATARLGRRLASKLYSVTFSK